MGWWNAKIGTITHPAYIEIKPYWTSLHFIQKFQKRIQIDPHLSFQIISKEQKYLEEWGNRTPNLVDWNHMRYHYANPPEEHMSKRCYSAQLIPYEKITIYRHVYIRWFSCLESNSLIILQLMINDEEDDDMMMMIMNEIEKAWSNNESSQLIPKTLGSTKAKAHQ